MARIENGPRAAVGSQHVRLEQRRVSVRNAKVSEGRGLARGFCDWWRRSEVGTLLCPGRARSEGREPTRRRRGDVRACLGGLSLLRAEDGSRSGAEGINPRSINPLIRCQKATR